MKTGSQLLPVGAVLTSILSLQFGAAFATTLFSQIGPAGATTLRLTIAAIILGVIVRPRWSRWSNRQRKGIFALGIALAVMNGAFYLALETVPIGTAVTIEFLGPLTLAAVLSRRWADGAWVLLAFGGVLLLGLGDHGESGLDPIGVMFALIAAAAWAGYIVAGSHLAATLPSADGLAGASIVAAVLTLPSASSPAGVNCWIRRCSPPARPSPSSRPSSRTAWKCGRCDHWPRRSLPSSSPSNPLRPHWPESS
ncbi:hypothetical protein GCM10020255_063120 [Rhodococcus baikonurensis]